MDFPAAAEGSIHEPDSDVHDTFSELFSHGKEEKYESCFFSFSALSLVNYFLAFLVYVDLILYIYQVLASCTSFWFVDVKVKFQMVAGFE